MEEVNIVFWIMAAGWLTAAVWMTWAFLRHLLRKRRRVEGGN